MKKILLTLVALMATMTSFAQVTLADLAGTYKGTGYTYGDATVEASFTLTYADEALTLTSLTFGSLTISDLSVACTLENGVLSISDYYYDYPYTSIDACKVEVVDKDNLKFVGDGESALGLYYMDEDYNEYSYWFNVGQTVSKNGATAIQALQFSKETNAQTYNLAGQSVGKNYKGIVVKNGRKYFVK